MSVKELNEKKNSNIPYEVRLKTAIKTREFKAKADLCGFKNSLEVFNNMDITKDADSVGITLYYPDADSFTHSTGKIFRLDMGTKEFEKQVKSLAKQFLKKIPKNKD